VLMLTLEGSSEIWPGGTGVCSEVSSLSREGAQGDVSDFGRSAVEKVYAASEVEQFHARHVHGRQAAGLRYAMVLMATSSVARLLRPLRGLTRSKTASPDKQSLEDTGLDVITR
jgi:hypothetical protein